MEKKCYFIATIYFIAKLFPTCNNSFNILARILYIKYKKRLSVVNEHLNTKIVFQRNGFFFLDDRISHVTHFNRMHFTINHG